MEYYKVVNSSYGSVCAIGKYYNIYGLGKIVEASEGTLGIMVFDSYTYACNFRNIHGDSDCRILAVEGMRRATRPKQICMSVKVSIMDEFYDERNSKSFSGSFNYASTMSPPIGTVCYKKIRVLREVKE